MEEGPGLGVGGIPEICESFPSVPASQHDPVPLTLVAGQGQLHLESGERRCMSEEGSIWNRLVSLGQVPWREGVGLTLDIVGKEDNSDTFA